MPVLAIIQCPHDWGEEAALQLMFQLFKGLNGIQSVIKSTESVWQKRLFWKNTTDPRQDWRLRDAADLAVVHCSGSLLDNIWAMGVEKLLWNVHDIQKSLGKLQRKRAMKKVPSVIFTSSGCVGLFVSSTIHTTSATKPFWHERDRTTTAERAKMKA